MTAVHFDTQYMHVHIVETFLANVEQHKHILTHTHTGKISIFSLSGKFLTLQGDGHV
jgi:hypothetical protein